MSSHPHADHVATLLFGAMKDLSEGVPSLKPQGWPAFTKITGGFRAREFTILCGSTGSGKTTWCANIVTELALQGEPLFVASVETGPTDFVRRMISYLVDQDWNKGDLVAAPDLQDFKKTRAEKLAESNLWISLYEDRFSIETLLSDLDYMISEYGIKLAVIDNLNFFMEVTAASQQVVEMDRVIHELIIFCKTRDVHVIMIMHPKKTEHGKVLSEFDIKGSSTAVQEAHNVFLFNKGGVSADGRHTYRELKIAKMRRNGRAVGKTLVYQSSNGVKYEEFKIVEDF